MEAQTQEHQKQINIQFRKEILSLISYQYSTDQFPLETHSFHTLLPICQKSLRKNHQRIRYELTLSNSNKYNMKFQQSSIDPFPHKERQSLIKLAELCNQCIRSPDYKLMAQLSQYIVNELNQPSLTYQYRAFYLRFKYISLKEAMIFTGLSQCRIWHTIVKQRRRSGKQCSMDPLINHFNNFVKKWQIVDPFHISVIPRKHVRKIQQKTIEKKSKNILFEAVSNRNIPKIKELILNGYDIQFPAYVHDRMHNKQMRVSHKACGMGDLQICRILHSYGADWQAQDNQKMSPLFYAILSGSQEIVKFLVEEVKVDMEKREIQNRTPFYWACTQGDIKIIQYLAKMGANVNQKSTLGRTALSKSCYLGRIDIVKYLLSLDKIDIMIKDKKGRTPLHNATFGPKGGRQGHKFGTNQKDSPQCALILLQKGFPVDQVDQQNNTSLHIAMSSDAVDSVRLLIAHGASLKARNNYQETPLLTGSKFGHIDSVSILTEQFNDDIQVCDIFNKNVLLLTAKFRQETGMNIIFQYMLEKLLKKLVQKKNFAQIQRTLKQLIQGKYVEQLTLFLAACEKLEIAYEKFEYTLSDIKSVLELSQSAKETMVYILKKIQPGIYAEQKIELLKIILDRNQIHLAQLIYEKCPQIIKQPMKLVAPKYLFAKIQVLKQKMVTFCLLTVDFNWLDQSDDQNANILHYLVRYKKIGPLIQLMKAMSGIKSPLLKNRFVLQKSNEELSEIFRLLLIERDSEGFDPYQFAKMIKQATMIKLFQDKIKEFQIDLAHKVHWDVKQYKVDKETDQEELKKFQKYELQDQLVNLCQKIDRDWEKIRTNITQLKINPKQAWQKFDQRTFYYCDNEQILKQVQKLNKQPMIGIDIEYFFQDGVIIASTFQISTFKEDYLIDCLSPKLSLKIIADSIKPILYNPNVIKLMHGADNDLILLKNNFNLSILNFLDTARIDLQITKANNLRGLGTICSQYLQIVMPKEHQVSEWRIRPLPKTMQFYARRDSMILPYLVVELLTKVPIQAFKVILSNGCKGAKKNRKATQPLIRSITPIN